MLLVTSQNLTFTVWCLAKLLIYLVAILRFLGFLRSSPQYGNHRSICVKCAQLLVAPDATPRASRMLWASQVNFTLYSLK